MSTIAGQGGSDASTTSRRGRRRRRRRRRRHSTSSRSQKLSAVLFRVWGVCCARACNSFVYHNVFRRNAARTRLVSGYMCRQARSLAVGMAAAADVRLRANLLFFTIFCVERVCLRVDACTSCRIASATKLVGPSFVGRHGKRQLESNAQQRVDMARMARTCVSDVLQRPQGVRI
jgi:NhaP-type Na+/H+ and K+/H+ antiporter